jgi:anti-sigma factor RsiW
VAQEQHLTIEQLSAFLDRQLSPQEQVECDIHLQRCQQCQSLLAELRQTVSILHALPQPELPRSFMLPARTLSVAEDLEPWMASITPITRGRRRPWQTYLLRSTRVISTIAAVLGILFIMSSFLTALLSLPHGGTASTASAPVFSSAQSQSPIPPASAQSSNATGPGRNLLNPIRKPRGTATSNQAETNAPTPVPTAVNTIIPTSGSTTSNSNGQQGYAQTQSVPPLLDLSMPGERAGVGFILLILGILGAFLTRRRPAKIRIP